MPFSYAAVARRTTPGPKSMRYGVSLTTMAVAGPARFGSGRGVPVPSMTTRAEPFERVVSCDDCTAGMAEYPLEEVTRGDCGWPGPSAPLVEAHVGRRDDFGPSLPIALEPCRNLGADDSGGC